MMLDIDAPKVTELIENYITDLVDKQKKSCVIMGLSGGIDSAVLVTLAARAVGPERVKTYYLKDRDNEPDSEIKAREMAEWLGVGLETQDITPEMIKRGIYKPFIMHLNRLAQFLNRFLMKCYFLIFREAPLLTSLKGGCGQLGSNPVKKLVYNLIVVNLEKSFNARHLYRREVIEQAAAEQNGLLLGAGNRSEGQVGWFVKEGIDDMPIQPMFGLYKTQIWQLAEYLDLPADIRQQAPSPDMMKGVTDEFGIGLNYRRLDVILDYLDAEMTEAEILAQGVTADELQYVRDIKHYSSWKREAPHVPPPVHGGAGSKVRIARG